MKKEIILTAFTFGFVYSLAIAQRVHDDVYKWTNPFHTGNAIYNMTKLNDNSKWLISTNEGTLLQSIDSGATWDSYYFFNNGLSSESGRKIHIINSNTLLFGGDLGLGLIDLNFAGVPQQISLFQNKINDINFPSPAVGYACGDNGELLTSIDSGFTWTMLPIVSSPILNQIVFSNDSVGLLSAFDSNILAYIYLRTINGGMSWDTILQGVPDLFGVSFSNDSTLFVYGRSIYRSTDYGNTWNQIFVPTDRKTFTAIHFFNDSIVSGIVDNGGQLRHSTDGGHSWSYQNYYLSTTFKNYFFNQNDSISFAYGGTDIGGDRANLLKSTNSGQTWQYITKRIDDYDIYHAQMLSSKDGYCQLRSHVTKTNDYNNSIQVVLTGAPGAEFFYGLFFTDINNGYVVGIDGSVTSGISSLIYKTKDAGQNWEKLNTGTTGELDAIFFVSPSTGFCVGYNEPLLKTIDSGYTWSSVPGNIVGKEIIFYNSQIGIVEGTSNGYYITTDGGNTWNNPFIAFKKIKFISADSLLCLNGFFDVMLSTDTGATWNYLFSNPNPDFTSVIYDYSFEKDLQTGYVMTGEETYNGNILGRTALYYTTDGGINWNTEPVFCGLYMNVLTSFTPDTVFMFGAYQSIIRKPFEINYNTSINYPVVNNNICFVVYPNPANNIINFDFKNEMDNKKTFTLQVFDLTGKLILQQTTNKNNSQDTKTQLNVANIENGIYFLKLSSKSDSIVKKIIVQH